MKSNTTLQARRIAIYARYSSEQQSESSIDDQIRICKEHVVELGGDADNTKIFTDKAISGASLARAGFEEMMSAVKNKTIDFIVTENLDRISRDLADSATLFRELKYLGVTVKAVSGGFDSSAEHATVMMMMEAWKNEMYLKELAFKTRRGLEGRALSGYSTGGQALGYTTVDELDGDGRVIGKRIVVEEDGAAVVRRIFDMYLEGNSHDAIARRLNAEQVPPPRKGKYRYKGWVGGTVRAILHNDAYVGVWTWGQRQWLKVPGTNKRRYRRAAADRVITKVFEDRRIISQETWDAVQRRIAEVRACYTRSTDGKPKGKALPGKNTFYPLSGVLKCGLCGSVMTISGGSSSRYYLCSAAKKRGTCANRLSLREDVARKAVLEALHERFTNPKAVAFLCKQVAEGLGGLNRELNRELDERRARLAKTKANIANLVQFIADGNKSATIAATLEAFETQQQQEQRDVDSLLEAGRTPVRLPLPEDLVAKEFELEAILAEDPNRGREMLAQFFENGSLPVYPQPNGGYIAKSRFFPLAMLSMNTKPRSPFPEAGLPVNRQSRGLSPSYSSPSCAGRI